jgi:signal transduction histidine kinase
MGQIRRIDKTELDLSGVEVNHFDITRKELHLAGGAAADAAPAASKLSELEAALQESQSMALAGQFAAATMHDINGPLEAITNLNYLLRINCSGNARALNYSQQIDEQLKFLAGITRQTLSYHRVHPQPESLAVSFLVEAALRIHHHKILRNQIHLVKELPCDIFAEVHPGSMLQVFSNLIANAVEVMPAGGTLWLRVRCSDTEVHIVVADQGTGIPAPIRGKIFEPFFSTKREHGTGLGLAITKSIVEKHSGRIRCWTSTSSGRSGTAFRISLPISLTSPPVTN